MKKPLLEGREEDEQQKAKKKKKSKISDDYLEDYTASRRMSERDRVAKRRSTVELGKYGTEHAYATKRQRGGEIVWKSPVSKKEAPDYLDIIKHPMDLSTIREKARKMEYKHREEFRHDVWRITYNAHLYNDSRSPGIPPFADQLLELCDYLLKGHSYSLSEAEYWIESREL